MKKSDLVLSPGQRIILFVCIFMLCYLLAMGAIFVVGRLLGNNIGATVRISAVVQDVFAFIIPAVLTALLVTRRPAQLLALTKKTDLLSLAIVACILFVSVPLQETIIAWNASIHFPPAIESLARNMENLAAETMKVFMSDTSVVALIVNILIVGIAAGFSEELFFRGCLQRMLVIGGANRHVVIWFVAVLFSAFHFQFYGFVPRMLLGAYFGYLLLWSRSIWLPIFAHALNNSIYCITAWMQVRKDGVEILNNPPTATWQWYTVALSALGTLALLYILWRRRKISD